MSPIGGELRGRVVRVGGGVTDVRETLLEAN
jgi:hypothetical protein